MTRLTVLPLASLITGILLSLIIGVPLFLGILFAILVTLVTLRKLGYPYREQFRYGWEGANQTKTVLLILFLIGLLIPLLMMGGTIPAIIYYGLSVVNVDYLLVLSFLLTSAVSWLLGTSVGTLSTVGLSLMGIAHAVEVPLGMEAGALISGAMVGERFSPISSSRLLLFSSVGLEARTNRWVEGTALVAVVFTALLFSLLDLTREHAADSGMIAMYQELLQRYFSVHPLQLIPLIVLIGSFAFRVKAIPALLGGLAASAALVFLTRPVDAGVLFQTILNGFELNSNSRLDPLVHGGGIKAILQLLLLIGLAGFMNGILNKANLLRPVVERLMGETQNRRVLAGKVVALSLLVVMISCNQTIPILVLGSTLLGRFSQLPDGKRLLARTMLDSTLLIPVLVPWCGFAMINAVTLGVPTLETLPYIFFALLLPIVTMLSVRHTIPAGSLLQEENCGR